MEDATGTQLDFWETLGRAAHDLAEGLRPPESPDARAPGKSSCSLPHRSGSPSAVKDVSVGFGGPANGGTPRGAKLVPRARWRE